MTKLKNVLKNVLSEAFSPGDEVALVKDIRLMPKDGIVVGGEPGGRQGKGQSVGIAPAGTLIQLREKRGSYWLFRFVNPGDVQRKSGVEFDDDQVFKTHVNKINQAAADSYAATKAGARKSAAQPQEGSYDMSMDPQELLEKAQADMKRFGALFKKAKRAAAFAQMQIEQGDDDDLDFDF